jgi:hypothetical protein
MSITHCKLQQQTRFPNRYKHSSNWPGSSSPTAVSISDVAKLLLESAKQDRLDFRLEAAE